MENGMDKEQILKNLSNLEKFAKGSKARRFFTNPFKYSRAIYISKVLRKQKPEGVFVESRTFFGANMNLLLPSAIDIYLAGGKTHDSEIRLAKYLISALDIGDSFLDVGAHYGYFSLLASQLVGPTGNVISIEASPKTFEILESNIGSNENVSSLNRFVGSNNGNEEFYEFPALYSEYNTKYPEQFDGEAWLAGNRPEVSSIESISLDSLLKTKKLFPEILKIDAEGAELEVIHGLSDYLRDHSLSVVMEFQSEVTKNEQHYKAIEYFESFGYFLHVIDSNGLLKRMNTNQIENYFLRTNLGSDNFVFDK